MSVTCRLESARRSSFMPLPSSPIKLTKRSSPPECLDFLKTTWRVWEGVPKIHCDSFSLRPVTRFARLSICVNLGIVLLSTRWNPGRHLGRGTEKAWDEYNRATQGVGLRRIGRERGGGGGEAQTQPRSQGLTRLARTKMAAETNGWIYPLPTKNACFAGWNEVQIQRRELTRKAATPLGFTRRMNAAGPDKKPLEWAIWLSTIGEWKGTLSMNIAKAERF